jgi:hypothetical protein
MARAHRGLTVLGAAGLLLVSCSVSSVSTGTPAPAAFDVGNVARIFHSICEGPDASVRLDADFCREVRLDSLGGEGRILRVPTTVQGAGSVARATAICRLFAIQHRNTTTPTTGYESIDILDPDGATLFSCSLQ